MKVKRLACRGKFLTIWSVLQDRLNRVTFVEVTLDQSDTQRSYVTEAKVGGLSTARIWLLVDLLSRESSNYRYSI